MSWSLRMTYTESSRFPFARLRRYRYRCIAWYTRDHDGKRRKTYIS